MGLAQLGDEFIDLDRLIGPTGELAHLREPSGSESVVLGATSRARTSSGALKSRSVEKRPALPARNFLSAVPPLKTRSRSNNLCS